MLGQLDQDVALLRQAQTVAAAGDTNGVSALVDAGTKLGDELSAEAAQYGFRTCGRE